MVVCPPEVGVQVRAVAKVDDVRVDLDIGCAVADCRGDQAQPLGVPVDEDEHIRALGGQLVGHRLTHAARGTGDDGRGADEVASRESHAPILLRSRLRPGRQHWVDRVSTRL